MIGSSIVASPEDGLDKLARHARGGLVVLAGLHFVYAAFSFIAVEGGDKSGIVSLVVLGTLFAALAVWARRNPLPPVIAGLAIFTLNLLVTLWIEPLAVLSMWGLLLNGAILTISINGLMTAIEHRRAKRRVATERAAK
jgi:hypothetical protein